MATQNIETTIYGGDHTILFKSGNHRYYVDGKPVQGVTTIMGKVLAKPELMLWPLNMAIKYLEPLLPSITAEDLEESKKAHVKRRDAGADTGTIVHSVVEQLLNGETAAWLPNEEVSAAVDGFLAWRNEHNPVTIATEQVVYSELYNYAGTFDSILRIDGKTYLCDLKTTNASRDAPKGVYADYFIQLGAYLAAYEEQREYELAKYGSTELVKIDDLMILSCKKDGKVHAVTASDMGLTLQTCASLWENTIQLFRGITPIKEALKG